MKLESLRTAPTGVLFGKKRSGVLLPRILLGLAAGIATYLAVTSLRQGNVMGCGGSGSCSEVLKSKWSSILGLPVSIPGLLAYIFVIAMAGKLVRGAQDALTGLGRLALWLIPLGAIWFVFVQAAIVKAFCPWCCTAHALATVAVVLILRASPRSSGNFSWSRGLAFAGMIGMAFVQAISPDPVSYASANMSAAQTETKAAGPTVVSLHDGAFKFSLDEYPVSGSTQAAHVLVAITDYACGHCRHLHQDLVKVLDAHAKEDLAVLWVPGMRNDNSAEIHRMMLALWKTDRAAHTELDKQLFAGEVESKPEAVKAAIIKRLGSETAFTTMTAQQGKWAHDQVYRAFTLFNKNGEVSGKAMLPMLMAGSQVLVGAIKNPLIYHQVIAKELGLPVPEDIQQAAIAAAAKNKAEAEAPVTKQAVLDGKTSVSLDAFPIMGSTRAAHALVVISDLYACAPCRQLHEFLPQVLAQYERKDLSVLWLPGMLTEQSGEISRLMLALWKQDPGAYEALNADLMQRGGVAAAQKKITERLGGDAAFQAMQEKHGAWATEQLKISTELFKQAASKSGQASLPTMIAGNQVLSGAIKNPLIYQQVFAKEFGIKPMEKPPVVAAAPAPEVKPVAPEVRSSVANGVEIPGFKQNGMVLTYHETNQIDTAALPSVAADVRRLASRLDGSSSADSGLVTSPSTEVPLVLLMDFLSPASRAMAAELKDGKRAFTILPAMPSGDAQSVHRVMLTLWKEKPEAWTALVEKLLVKGAQATPGSITADVTKAVGGDEKLAKAMEHHKVWLQETLVTTHRIYQANNRILGGPKVPQLLVGAKVYSDVLPTDLQPLQASSASSKPSAALTSAH